MADDPTTEPIVDADATERTSEMRAALERILGWCEAYPVRIFPALSDDDLKRAHAALQSVGLSSDRLHAAWARHIMAGVQRLARDGLGDAQR